MNCCCGGKTKTQGNKVEQLIQQLLRHIRIAHLICLLLPIIALVLGEMNVFPVGLLIGKSSAQHEFMLQTGVILGTLVLVPLALKLFSLNTKSTLYRYTLDGAVRTYRTWSIVRLAILTFCALGGLAAYFLTLHTNGALCAAISYVVLLGCAPSKHKIETYLENSKNDVA